MKQLIDFSRHRGRAGLSATTRICCVYYYYYYLLHHKVAHREYNIKQQNAKTLEQYDAKMHKRVSAIKIYKYT